MKDELQKRLTDLEFVDDEEALKNFRCQRCRQMALSHYFANCHHFFCKKCFDHIFMQQCPVSNCSNHFIVHDKQDLKFEIALYQLRVRCLWSKNGCEETLPLNQLMDHYHKCPWSEQNLLPKMWHPNSSNQQIYVEELQKEVRDLKNDVRMLLGKVATLEERFAAKEEEISQIRADEKKYKKDVIEEVNGHLKALVDVAKGQLLMDLGGELGRKLERECPDLENRLNEKIKMEINHVQQTNMKDIKECIQVQKEEMSKVIERKCSNEFQKLDGQFKELIDEKMDQYNQVVDKVKSEMNDSLRLKMESKDVKWIISEFCLSSSLSPGWVEWALEERRTDFVWKVPGVRSLLQRWKEGKGHLLSEVFVTKEFAFKIRAQLECNYRRWIDLSIEFVKEEEEEATPTRPSVYLHRRTFVLMDQSEGSGPKRDIVHIREPRFGNWEAKIWMNGLWVYPKFVSMERLESGAPYVVDDALCLRILIEPLSVLWKLFASNDGTLLWTIDDYSQKKKDSLEGVIQCFYSDYFYSSPRGFRMRIQFTIHSNGDLRMWVVFWRGEWDNDLSERFPHKTTLTILDRSDSEQKKHLIRTEESDSTGENWIGWIRRPELESGPYLKDDRLMVNVVVEPK